MNANWNSLVGLGDTRGGSRGFSLILISHGWRSHSVSHLLSLFTNGVVTDSVMLRFLLAMVSISLRSNLNISFCVQSRHRD